MRKQLSIIAAMLVVVLAAGCKNNPATSTDANARYDSKTSATTAAAASSLSPEDLGELGAKIKKQPNDADKLLAERGLNEQSFASAIRKVSENPDQAKRYTAAYKKASA
jgi:hypothetical protein